MHSLTLMRETQQEDEMMRVKVDHQQYLVEPRILQKLEPYEDDGGMELLIIESRGERLMDVLDENKKI